MQPQKKTIDQLTEEVIKTFNSYTAQGTKKWNWESAAKDLPYQVGSVTKIMLQLSNERWADGKNEEELKAELSDELADILAETLFIAHNLGINLEEAWNKMLESDKKKIGQRLGK